VLSWVPAIGPGTLIVGCDATNEQRPEIKNEASRYDRILTVSITIFCQAFQVIILGGLGLFLPTIRADLGFSYTQAGVLFSLATLTYALMQIPAGFLVDRYGPRKLFFIGSLTTNLLVFAFGWATAFWMLLPIQAVTGIFRALVFVPGLTLVVTWFPPDRRATAMGIYTVGGFLGTAMLSLAGPALVETYSWRAPFLLFSSIGVVASLAYLVLSKERPSTDNRKPINVKEMLALFRYRVMWLAGGIQYVRLAVVSGLRFWIPSYLADEHDVSLPVIGIVIAVSGILTASANFFGGYISDRLKNPPLVIGGALLVLAIAIAMLAMADNLVILVLLVLVTALFQQLYFGPLFAAPVEILGIRNAGLTIGFTNMFANVGALTFGYGIGTLKDITGGFSAGFYTLAGCCLIGLVLTALLARERIAARTNEHQEDDSSPM